MAEKNGLGKLDFVYRVLKNLLSSMIITALLLLAVSTAYIATDIGEEFARTAVTVSAVFAVFASSFIGGRKMRKHGLITGAAAGFMYTAVLYMTGFMAFGLPAFGKGALPSFGLSILIGAIGGIAGVNIGIKK